MFLLKPVPFLPQRIFDRIVANYKSNYKIRHFSCWNQMMCMMFGLLHNRDSLSDLVLTIIVHPAKFYHLGFGKGISKITSPKQMKKETGVSTRSVLIF